MEHIPTVLRLWRLRGIGAFISWLGSILFIIGIITGWVLPHIVQLPSTLGIIRAFADIMQSPISARNDGLTTFLSADVAALAVIVAILIGYNVVALQIATQSISVGLTRAMLFTLVLFVLGWMLSLGTVLVYLLNPPSYIGQYWQVAIWFVAISLLAFAHVFELPLRVSGEYAASWSFKDMRRTALGDWQTANGFSILQGGITAATRRGDILTVRTMDIMLGEFLSGVCDQKAEDHPGFNRDQYWTLYNLLGGCAQGSDVAPNAVSYNLGFVTAGLMLQAIAIGQPIDDPRSNIFRALWENASPTPNYVNSLWAGLRYGLCRSQAVGGAYLLRYWQSHERWTAQDERRIIRVASGLLRLHQDCWQKLSIVLTADEASEQAVILLTELYRYIGVYLASAAIQHRSFLQRVRRVRPFALFPLALLDAINHDALALWPTQQVANRAFITDTYNTERINIVKLLATVGIAAPATPHPL